MRSQIRHKEVDLVSIRNWITSEKTIQAIKDHSAVLVIILTLSMYGVYTYALLRTGEKINELFFIPICLSASYFSFMSYPTFKRLAARTLTLFFSTFFLSLLVIYVRYWVIKGHATTNYKWSLFAGLIMGTLHLIYCLIKNRNRKDDIPIDD